MYHVIIVNLSVISKSQSTANVKFQILHPFLSRDVHFGKHRRQIPQLAPRRQRTRRRLHLQQQDPCYPHLLVQRQQLPRNFTRKMQARDHIDQESPLRQAGAHSAGPERRHRRCFPEDHEEMPRPGHLPGAGCDIRHKTQEDFQDERQFQWGSKVFGF